MSRLLMKLKKTNKPKDEASKYINIATPGEIFCQVVDEQTEALQWLVIKTGKVTLLDDRVRVSAIMAVPIGDTAVRSATYYRALRNAKRHTSDAYHKLVSLAMVGLERPIVFIGGYRYRGKEVQPYPVANVDIDLLCGDVVWGNGGKDGMDGSV